MSKDITEYIDDYCRDSYGHINWAYLSSLSEKAVEEIKGAVDLQALNVEEVDYSTGIVFYKWEKYAENLQEKENLGLRTSEYEEEMDREQEDVSCDFKHEFDSPHKLLDELRGEMSKVINDVELKNKLMPLKLQEEIKKLIQVLSTLGYSFIYDNENNIITIRKKGE